MRRVIERSGQSAYLLLCTMTDGKGVPLEKGERLGKVAEELEQAIRNSLRRGDMFTRYSDNQFLMLLLGIRQEDCVGKDTLENHLHCLSVLRNKCAHAARMYNTDFNPPAKFTSSFLRKHPERII